MMMRADKGGGAQISLTSQDPDWAVKYIYSRQREHEELWQAETKLQ